MQCQVKYCDRFLFFLHRLKYNNLLVTEALLFMNLSIETTSIYKCDVRKLMLNLVNKMMTFENICNESVFVFVQKGDVLLSIGGTSLLHLTHAEAVGQLKIQAETKLLMLKIIEGPETSTNLDNFVPSWLFWLKMPKYVSQSLDEYWSEM